MGLRHYARETALQLLYQYDSKSKVDSNYLFKADSYHQEIQNYFKHSRTPEKLKEFVSELVIGTLSHLSEVDSLISKQALHWKLHRMHPIDRCILRLAIYELFYTTPATPSPIIIDEAIELAKTFGGSEQTPAFVNGILDSLVKKKIFS